jgi:predicted transcriptional regulator
MEWALMETLWTRAPLSATEVYECVSGQRACTGKTVRVLLDRLRAKGAVSRERKHGVWVYSPAIDRDALLLEKSRTFLSRFFDADPVPLFAHLVRNDVLSDDDVAELRALIDEYERKKEARDE